MIDWMPLILIPVIYFGMAMIRPVLGRHGLVRPCAMCSAVMGTWIVLAVWYLLGGDVSATALGILMGMSVGGSVTKLERLYKSHNWPLFWVVCLSYLTGGYVAVMSFLIASWNVFFFTVIGTGLIIVVSIAFVNKPPSGTPRQKPSAETEGGVFKRLDDCC